MWVLWGPSGTGKSRFVAKRWPKAFWKSPEAKWWDGYAGQEVVVLDDFKDYAMPLSTCRGYSIGILCGSR